MARVHQFHLQLSLSSRLWILNPNNNKWNLCVGWSHFSQKLVHQFCSSCPNFGIFRREWCPWQFQLLLRLLCSLLFRKYFGISRFVSYLLKNQTRIWLATFLFAAFFLVLESWFLILFCYCYCFCILINFSAVLENKKPKLPDS